MELNKKNMFMFVAFIQVINKLMNTFLVFFQKKEMQ